MGGWFQHTAQTHTQHHDSSSRHVLVLGVCIRLEACARAGEGTHRLATSAQWQQPRSSCAWHLSDEVQSCQEGAAVHDRRPASCFTSQDLDTLSTPSCSTTSSTSQPPTRRSSTRWAHAHRRPCVRESLLPHRFVACVQHLASFTLVLTTTLKLRQLHHRPSTGG